MMCWFKRRPPGVWVYGPRFGRYQNRWWVTHEEAKRLLNPQPPPGGGGIHRKPSSKR